MTPTIELHDERGHVETLHDTDTDGSAPRGWWHYLDANNICRHCLYNYDDCTCPEANDDH